MMARYKLTLIAATVVLIIVVSFYTYIYHYFKACDNNNGDIYDIKLL